MKTMPATPERRANQRIPVSFDAVLYYNTLMLPDCRVSDISPGGAFVQTGGQSLPDRAVLDLAIGVQTTNGVPQRIPAQVMRSNERGVGVRLGEIDAASLRGLVEAMYSA